MATKTVTDQSFAADVLGSDRPRARRFLGGMVRPVPDDRARRSRKSPTSSATRSRSPSSTSTRIRTSPAATACAASRPCCCSRAASRSRRRSAPRRAARSSSGSRAISNVHQSATDDQGVPSSPRVSGRNLSWRGKLVARLEPADPCLPRRCGKPGAIALGLVERRDAEIDRFGLVIDLHQEAACRTRRRNRGGRSSMRRTVRTLSAPLVQAKSPSGTLAKTMAGAPLLSWQVRQWHQPQSNGSLSSS